MGSIRRYVKQDGTPLYYAACIANINGQRRRIQKKSFSDRNAARAWINANEDHSNSSEYMSLCWYCGRRISECSWLSQRQPIKGWQIETRKACHRVPEFATVVKVQCCPLYVEPEEE